MTTRTFQIKRTIAAPPDRLWHLLTDPRAREAWGVPADDIVLVIDVEDLREGGQERHRCGPKEAPEFIIDTHWYHLAAPGLACFTETLTMGCDRIAVTLVTYHLAGGDDGTELTVDVAAASMTGDPVADDFHGGWTNALDRLQRLLAEGAFA